MQQIFIRKSPVVIIRDLLLLQFIGTIAYGLLSELADYGFVYNQYSVSEIISYGVVRVAVFSVIEIFIVGLIFAKWLLEGYTISNSRVVIERGMLFRKRRFIQIEPPVSVSFSMGALGRLFRYGVILISTPRFARPIVLRHVPDAPRYAKRIRTMLGTGGTQNLKPLQISDILSGRAREHEHLEFKSTFRWDLREGKVNRALERAALKTVAAFLNSQGGHVIIGIDDTGNVLGLDADYASLERPDADGFENHFTNVFKAAVGPEFRQFVKLGFHPAGEKEICVIQVAPSSAPAYLRGEAGEFFYIRTGNSTSALQLREAAAYINSRWS